MVDEKKINKNREGKIKELKIELLKNPTKRKGIKKEIARVLTQLNSKEKTKLEEKK